MFTYCPKCGGKFKRRNLIMLQCQSCQFEWYENPKCANAGLLLNQKNQLLLTTRKYDPQKGCLDLAGGFIQKNETAEESTRREIREELGVEIKNLCYYTSYNDLYLYKNVTYDVLILTFTGIITEPTQIADDINGYQWFDLPDVPINGLAFPNMKIITQRFINERLKN